MSGKSPPSFKDDNFKLAVIQALIQQGELKELVRRIEHDERYSGDGPASTVL